MIFSFISIYYRTLCLSLQEIKVISVGSVSVSSTCAFMLLRVTENQLETSGKDFLKFIHNLRC